MVVRDIPKFSVDHCRIGSLENLCHGRDHRQYDHCRIGSLEITTITAGTYKEDHCRIGSLEK